VTVLETFCEFIKVKDPYENIVGKTTSGWGNMEKVLPGSTIFEKIVLKAICAFTVIGTGYDLLPMGL